MNNPDQTELLRRLDNVIRLGTIAEVDLTMATARVKAGGITTDFLPWLTFRAGKAKSWSAPTIGEQCVVLSVSGEFNTGVILVGLYTQNAPSQSADEHIVRFDDGAEINYNTASSQLTVKNCKVVIVQASETIELNTPLVKATQNVEINGKLKVTGEITTESDVKAGGISLKNHVHGSSPKPS